MKNELINTENRSNDVREHMPPAKKDSSGGKLLLIMLAILLVVAGAVAAVLIIRNGNGTLGERRSVKENKVEMTPEEMIQEAVQALGLMDTASSYYTHVSTMSESKELFGITIPGTGNSYVITAEGKITAGVDFSAAKVTFDEENGEFTIKLPKVKVISNGIDSNSWQYFDEKGDVFKPLTVEDVGDTYNEIAKEEENKAIERGLLADAERMAKTIVTNYLNDNEIIGDNKITIVFGAK